MAKNGRWEKVQSLERDAVPALGRLARLQGKSGFYIASTADVTLKLARETKERAAVLRNSQRNGAPMRNDRRAPLHCPPSLDRVACTRGAHNGARDRSSPRGCIYGCGL